MMLAPYQAECAACGDVYEPEADESRCPDCRGEEGHV